MREIDNLTDQLGCFASEVAQCVQDLEAKGFSRPDAIQLTQLAIEDIKAETLHHKNKRLRDITDALEALASALDR